MSNVCKCDRPTFANDAGLITCMKCGKGPQQRTGCDSIGPKRDGINLRCTRSIGHHGRCSTYWHGTVTWHRPGSLQVREDTTPTMSRTHRSRRRAAP